MIIFDIAPVIPITSESGFLLFLKICMDGGWFVFHKKILCTPLKRRQNDQL